MNTPIGQIKPVQNGLHLNRNFYPVEFAIPDRLPEPPVEINIRSRLLISRIIEERDYNIFAKLPRHDDPLVLITKPDDTLMREPHPFAAHLIGDFTAALIGEMINRRGDYGERDALLLVGIPMGEPVGIFLRNKPCRKGAFSPSRMLHDG